jgi:hypothetical protein
MSSVWIMRSGVILSIFCISFLVLLPTASAHAPLAPGDNQDLSGATFIPDPLKSWVVYGHLHEPGESAYFRMEMAQGERLILALNVNMADAPVPDLILMGPDIPSSGNVPPSIEVPPGTGSQVIPGTAPGRGVYEAFSPSVIYEVASYSADIEIPGTYYAVVYNTGDELDYSQVVGYKEEFTAAEWLVIPFSQIGIYLWEGQSPWFVAAPYFVVILAGIGLMAWGQKRGERSRTIRAWVASLGGLLYISSGFSTINQMFWVFSFTGYSPESAITMLFASIPILLGIGALWIGRPGVMVTTRGRVSLVIIAGLGLVAWAGLIIGPVLVLLAVILPENFPQPQKSGENPKRT